MTNIGDFFSQNADSRSLAPGAVGSQVLLMTVVSAITIIVFNVLRPNNKIVYEPKVKYHVGDKKPPRISSGILGWISPLVYTKEPELVDKIGLDAATFLRFLRMMRTTFSIVALLTCVILIPINVSYNLKHVPSTDRDILSILTIRDVGGNFLWAHVGMVYVITGTVIVVVWFHWNAMVRLRAEFFRSPEYTQSFYARTLTVMRVPKKLQSDEGIRAIFDSVQVPYPTTSVHIGRRVGNLPHLIEVHNNTVREFEQVLVRYLKGGKVGRKRPTIRLGGFLGLGGKKRDAIDYYTEKLKWTEQNVEAYRAQIDTRKPENYGFASMAAVPYAHIVAQMLERKRPKGAQIDLAPNPKDIIWKNLNMSPTELFRKKMTGWFLLIIIVFLNTVPLFVLSILANLSSIASFVPFLRRWAQSSPSLFNFVSGVLPPAVSAFFGFFLPIIIRWLLQYMGALTQSRLDRAVVARYFAFLVISQLIIFTLIGVGFIRRVLPTSIVRVLIMYTVELPAKINQTYINQASYWLTFFPLRGFLVVFDLAQIISLLWISFKTHILGRTPRDYREFTQPPEFQYAIYYSNIVGNLWLCLCPLFMGTVGLVFAPLAPLVAVGAAIVMWISSWVYKYQLMFCFVSKVETGGRLWNPIINRLLVSLLLMQGLMLLTIGLQYGWKSFAWVAGIPPFIIVILFKIYIDRAELRNAQVHSQRGDIKGNRLERRFGHPALHTELFTLMLHANMMPLLPQVYSGRLDSEQAKLGEYGGQQMDARILPGGIKIAGVDQNDLEYDPVLYQRDRGELDWDQRSIATALNSTAGFPAGGRNSPAPSLPGYGRYFSQGPGRDSEIELSRFDADQQPLLPATLVAGGGQSSHSLPAYSTPQPPYAAPMPTQYPPPPGTAYHGQMPSYDGHREAPTHRPYPSRESSGYSYSNNPGRESPGLNVAGRGAFRR
ncbi:DUF221-domain-containing protein [Multifurca ochricompacta]|uniref:DUF221-domain-containing protein n=1 Tax=Multifurca ochricompacta TaxID=376703 RepID=A0AAD4M6M6_9AGAM|nr:DUF221-domain-containing protein [Multifurca ochricompacta]